MNNKSKAANPGLLVMALLLVLLALVVVLIAVILATGTKGNNDPNNTEAQDKTTTVQNILNSSTPNTTLPDDPITTTTPDVTTTVNVPNTGVVTTTANNVQTTTAPNTGTVTPTPGKNTISVSSSQKNQGSLLLIDKNHVITYREKFPARSELIGNTALQKELGLVRVKGTGDYKMPHSNHFLNASAAEYFYEMMDDFVEQMGSGDVFLRNAYYCDYTEEVPHANIHATGYAIDLQLMTDNGQYSLKSNSEFYKWFIDNCSKYGFIFVGDTQNSNTSSGYSTFRFVGTSHAGCMKIYDMSLDEYLSYITGRTAESCLRITDEFDVEWWIYYVSASLGETTDVTVFGDESCYLISGDNTGGFVVTINASKLG